MMDSNLLSLIFVVVIGVTLLIAIFVIPLRRLPEEAEMKPLYEERCFAYWQLGYGAVISGGNIPITRISFYENFFVVALMMLTKVPYSELLSVDLKKSWLSKSVIIQITKGRSLVIHTKNSEKIRSIIETHIGMPHIRLNE